MDGVWAYKRKSKKLQEIKSNIFNAQEHKKQKLEPITNAEPVEKKTVQSVAGSENSAKDCKPICIPGIHLASATNFIINLNFE